MRYLALCVTCLAGVCVLLTATPRSSMATWKVEAKCMAAQEPDFEADPAAWFDWFDDCASGPDTSLAGTYEPPPVPCHPGRFVENGRCWLLVCTKIGPMIEPCYEPNFELPMNGILAIKAAANGYALVVRTGKGFSLVRVPRGVATLRQLIGVAASQRALPTLELTKISRTFWSGSSASIKKSDVPASK